MKDQERHGKNALSEDRNHLALTRTQETETEDKRVPGDLRDEFFPGEEESSSAGSFNQFGWIFQAERLCGH